MLYAICIAHMLKASVVVQSQPYLAILSARCMCGCLCMCVRERERDTHAHNEKAEFFQSSVHLNSLLLVMQPIAQLDV